MTTLALPERWTFAGVDLSSYAIISPSVVGADELPPVRGDDFLRSGVRGRLYAPKVLDARRVALTLVVTALNAAGTYGGAAQARTNLDALLAVLGPRAHGALTRLMPDASTRTAQAECIAVNNVSDPVAHEIFTLTAQFALPDPVWYGASSTGPGSQSISASPTDFTFTLAGNVESNENLIINFTGGPLVHPRITNQTTGAYVDINETVANTKHLIIDPVAYTVLNDGADATPDMTHGPTLALFDLAPGANSIRVTAATPGGSVLITAYPGYY